MLTKSQLHIFWVRATALVLTLSLLTDLSGQSDRLDLSTPHDAIWVHLYYLQPDNYDPSLSATVLPTSIDSSRRVSLAIKLKQVFDGSGLYVHMNLLPTESDYLDTATNQAFYTPFPDRMPEIYLEKQGSVWRYSLESADKIEELHRKVYRWGTDRLIGLFDSRAERRLLGLSTWQYLGFASLVLFAFLAHLILRKLLQLMGNIMSGKKMHSLTKFHDLNRRLSDAVSLVVLVLILRMLVPILQLPISVAKYLIGGLEIITTVFMVIAVVRLINVLTAYLGEITSKTSSRMDDQLIPLLDRILKIIAIITGFIHVLHVLDVNVAAILAGISLGGLALALAAQDTVKNLLGSVMILTDKPFQIGDWVEGSDFAGTVVEIGFRTTRIRQTDTSIISVPNGNMANASVTNKGVRVMRLFQINLGITYDTPPELIEKFVEGIEEIIRTYPQTVKEDYYVRLTDLKDFSINILVRTHLRVTNYAEELDLRQALILAIMRWAEVLGVRFAFPTTTVEIESMPGQISLSPHPKTDAAEMDKKFENFFDQLRAQIPPEEDEPFVSDD